MNGPGDAVAPRSFHNPAAEPNAETRAVATDTTARKRSRWYWARFSPGIALIRYLMLAPLKAAAERRAADLTRAAAS